MSYKEEPNIYEDPLRKKSTAAVQKGPRNDSQMATPGAGKSPIEIDKSALGYGMGKNDEDVAFVDGGDHSVNILNGFNGEQTQSILVAKDDLMEEDERERSSPKKETGSQKCCKVIKFFQNLKFFTYNDDNLIQFDSNSQQKKTTKCKLFIMIVVAIPLIYLVLANYLGKLGLEKAQSIKYVSHSSLAYNVSDVPKLLPVHSFTYFLRKEVTDRMKCKINGDPEECLQIEKRRCESEDATTVAYEDCMLELLAKQENKLGKKIQSEFCTRHYLEDSKKWVGALSPLLEIFQRRKHACYEKAGIPKGREFCLDLEKYAGWSKERLFECYNKHRVESGKEQCDYRFKGNNRQLIQCYGSQGVEKDEEYCNAAFAGEQQVGDLIACFAEINLKNKRVCMVKYEYFAQTDKEYQTCLTLEAGETLNEEFCLGEYPSDKYQLEARYECYTRIGLDIVRDRKFCETKYPRDSAEKYQCLERLGLPKGADYCYQEYPWPRDYEEKYQCLEQEGLEKSPQYCYDKFDFIKKQEGSDQTVAIETCEQEFGIPMQLDACAGNVEYQTQVLKDKRLAEANKIAAEKSARFYDSFESAKNKFYLNQFAQIIADQFSTYFVDAQKANRIDAKGQARQKAEFKVMAMRKQEEKARQASAQAAKEEQLRIQQAKDAEAARLKAEQELIQRLTDDLFKILSGKLSEDRPLIKEEIAAILKAEAELAAKLMAIEEQQYRELHEKKIAENIEATIAEQIKAFQESYGAESAAAQEQQEVENAERISADIEKKIKEEFEVYTAKQQIIIDAIKKETDDAAALAEANAKRAAEEEAAKIKALEGKADAEKTVQEQSDKIANQTEIINAQNGTIEDQTEKIDNQTGTIEAQSKTISDEQAAKEEALKKAEEERLAKEQLQADLQKAIDAKDSTALELAQEKQAKLDTEQALAAEKKISGHLQEKLDEIIRVPTCNETHSHCDKSGYLCLKKTVLSVGDPYAKGYQYVKNSPGNQVGDVTLKCSKTENANQLVATSGIISQTTTITATYEFTDEALHSEQEKYRNEINPPTDVDGLTICQYDNDQWGCDVEQSTGLRKICIKQYILDISNPNDAGYQAALSKDGNLTKGNELFRCYPQGDDVDAVMAKHNKKDEDTTITVSYQKFPIPQPEERPAARHAQKAYDLKIALEEFKAQNVKDIATAEELKIKINDKTKEKEEAEAKRIADDKAEVEAAQERIKTAAYGTCSAEDTTSCEMGQVCIYRYINDISNPTAADYQNALAADPQLTKGNEIYSCKYISEKDAILALTNVKDELTTITSTYNELANKPQTVLTAEEEAAKTARAAAVQEIEKQRVVLVQEQQAADAKVEANKAEIERMTIEYNDAKALSEVHNPQTKPKEDGSGIRRRRLAGNETEEVQVDGNSTNVDANITSNGTSVDPVVDGQPAEKVADKVVEDPHGVDDGHGEADHGVVDSHGDDHSPNPSITTDNVVAEDHGHENVDHSNEVAHDDHPVDDGHSQQVHDDHSVDDHPPAEQKATNDTENQGNSTNQDDQQTQESQQGNDTTPENITSDGNQTTEVPPQTNETEQNQTTEAPQENNNNNTNSTEAPAEQPQDNSTDTTPETNVTSQDDGNQTSGNSTNLSEVSDNQDGNYTNNDTQQGQGNQTQEQQQTEDQPPASDTSTEAPVVVEDDDWKDNEEEQPAEDNSVVTDPKTEAPAKDDKEQGGSSASGNAPIVVNIGEIVDEKYMPFIGLLDQAKYISEYGFADYTNKQKYIDQIKRFEADTVRRSDQKFYAVYNHSMQIDGEEYKFSDMKTLSVQDTWVQYMKPQKFTMNQIMGEMTDLADIVGDLYVELDLPTAIGEETLTADQLRDNTGKVILDTIVPFNITQLFVDASILNQALLNSDQAIADSVKQPESCQSVVSGVEGANGTVTQSFTSKQDYIDYCEMTFKESSQIEIKTACLKKFGVAKTPEYCLQTLKVTHESFYYPTKNKYQCLTAPSNPFVVAIDDKATKCLNLYFDYAVEQCLLKYEQGNTLDFKSGKLEEYGIVEKPKEEVAKDEDQAAESEDQDGGLRRLEGDDNSPFTDQEIQEFLCENIKMQFHQNPKGLMPTEDIVSKEINLKDTETRLDLKCNSFSFRDNKQSTQVHHDSVVHFYLDEIKENDSELKIDRSESNLNEFLFSYEPNLEFLEIQQKRMYIREQQLDKDLDAPKIKDQEEFNKFRSDGMTVKIFEATKQILFEQQLPVISLQATPVKNEYIGKKPDKSIFGLVITFMDQLQNIIKIDSQLEKRHSVDIAVDDRDRTQAQMNKVQLFFKFSETQMKYEYFNFMDILTQLGGIAATINLTIGNLSVLFVIIYMTDLVNMIYKSYHAKYTKYKVEYKLQHLEKIGQVIQLIKNMKGNKDDTSKTITKDAQIPSLITQQVLDKLTMAELIKDQELYVRLLQVKKKSERKLNMQQMQRCESHDQIEDSDSELNHIDAEEAEKNHEQVLKDYDYLSKKYAQYVYIKLEDGETSLEDLKDSKNLFEDKSVNYYVLASRMRKNFFQIANQIKKRVSFYGIYESTDKIEITQQKLKHLRSQVEVTTTFMLEQIQTMNMEIEKRQTDKEITKYKNMIQEVYLKFIEKEDPTKPLSLEKEESILMGENLNIQKVRSVLDNQLLQVQRTQRALSLAGLQNPNNFMEELQNQEQKLDDKIDDKPKLFKRDKNRSSTIKSMLRQSQKKTGMKVVSNEEDQ